MTARERLDSMLAKVDRAKEHLHSLTSDVRGYLASNPYTVSARRDPESRRLIYFVSSIRPAPPKFSLILGDAIHNLRSALDHLAYQIVWVGTNKAPRNRVYFPITEDRTSYLKQRRRDLNGAKPDAIAEIDGLNPYKGGNDLLWKLHRLDIVDKHRVLIMAGSAFRSVNIGHTLTRELKKAGSAAPTASAGPAIPTLNLYLRPKDRMFPLKQGDELFIDAPDAEPSDEVQFQFEVAFGERDVVFGEPIVDTLASMATLVEGIVAKFERHLA